MSTEGRELGWDDTIQNDSSFVELPEGDYDFTIDHFERGRSKGSDKIPPSNMAIVYFVVKTADGQEATIKENFILHTRLEWKLSELFCGVGLKKKGEELRMNWNALPGLTGRAKVTLEPDRNDPSKKYNHINKIYPKENKGYTAGSF
jgi:hypothetical protein